MTTYKDVLLVMTLRVANSSAVEIMLVVIQHGSRSGDTTKVPSCQHICLE